MPLNVLQPGVFKMNEQWDLSRMKGRFNGLGGLGNDDPRGCRVAHRFVKYGGILTSGETFENRVRATIYVHKSGS
jgi:hypothetical protein